MLLLSAGIATGYLLSGGSLAVPSSSPALVALASASPGVDASPVPNLIANASPEASAAASSPGPIASASPEVSPSPIPEPSQGAVDALFPEGGRWDHLVPCPDAPDCYVYTVQRNDTLYAISRSFDVSIGTILDLNPRITNSKVVHVGQKITLPTPTP